MKKLFFVAGLSLLLLQQICAQTSAPVDVESKVHFVIKNLGINTGGDFKGLKGTLKFDPKNLAGSLFDITVDVKTVDTDIKKRDNHLQQEEYFNAAKFPTLRFKSSQVKTGTNGGFIVDGAITIKGVTKNISFPFKATAKNGGYLLEGSFELNRLDFGVGGESAVMADNVKIQLSIYAK